MVYLKRISVLSAVFLSALMIAPSALSGFLTNKGPDIAPAYAPYFPPANAPQGKGSEIEVFLKNFEFTQNSSSPGGGRVRD
jgi:hypothetical protein